MKHLRRLSLLGLFAVLNIYSIGAAHADIPSCTVVNSPPFWVDDGTVQIQCPAACADGSFLQCVANLQKEIQCVNGDIQIVGPSRPGSVISTIGTCPLPPPDPTPTPTPQPGPAPQPQPGPGPGPTPTPAACGDNASGTTWWQESRRHDDSSLQHLRGRNSTSLYLRIPRAIAM